MLKPGQVTVAPTSRCSDLMATNAVYAVAELEVTTQLAKNAQKIKNMGAGVWKWYGNK